VGHQVEYFAAVPEAAVRGWLDRLRGYYCSEPGDSTTAWEGELASGGTFWAYLTPAACNFALALKYSGLYYQQPPAVDFARRFEEEFWEQFGTVPLLRVDEYLVNEWHREVGREWEEFPQPVEELRSWLHSRDSHWHWLAPNASHPHPG
jgi:hypothetical protein